MSVNEIKEDGPGHIILDILGVIAFIVGITIVYGDLGGPPIMEQVRVGAGLMIVGIAAVAGPRVLEELFED